MNGEERMRGKGDRGKDRKNRMNLSHNGKGIVASDIVCNLGEGFRGRRLREGNLAVAFGRRRFR